MRQITYFCDVQSKFQVAELGAILYEARSLNRKHGVTGLLLFNGNQFLQALEGDEHVVGAAFKRISKHRRHLSIILLYDRSTDIREFGNWARTTNIRDDRDDTSSVVDLVKSVTSPEIRETFDKFATSG